MTNHISQGPAGPVHWTLDGTGPPAVLLHGLGGDAAFWSAEITAWRNRLQLVAVDLRGSAGTPSSPAGHTIADLADDVAAVLDDHGAQRAHVVGFSMGGLVAQALALRHPDRVDRLVLASTYAQMNPQARLFLDAVLAVYQQHRSAREMFGLIAPWLFSPAFLADPRSLAYVSLPDEALEDQSMEEWRFQYRAQQLFDLRGQLNQIAAPTLVLVGEQDSLVGPQDAEQLAAGIPRATLAVLPGAGHLVNVEQPERFQSLVLDFLSA